MPPYFIKNTYLFFCYLNKKQYICTNNNRNTMNSTILSTYQDASEVRIAQIMAGENEWGEELSRGQAIQVLQMEREAVWQAEELLAERERRLMYLRGY